MMLASRSLTTLVVLAASTSSAWSQEAPRARSDAWAHSVAITAGLGNMYGGLGIDVECMLSRRLSGVVGLGFVPEIDNPSTVGFAGAVRVYTAGEKRRAFLEFSVSLVSFEAAKLGGEWVQMERYYGPGLSVGYHYKAAGGFTFLISAGAGWAARLKQVGPIGLLGLGYTWPLRRRDPLGHAA